MSKLTASSPKLRPKNRNEAAEATAYDQVAMFDKAPWAGAKAGDIEGSPIKKKARPKKIQGADRTYTDGFNLNKGYHTADAARNTAPKT